MTDDRIGQEARLVPYLSNSPYARTVSQNVLASRNARLAAAQARNHPDLGEAAALQWQLEEHFEREKSLDGSGELGGHIYNGCLAWAEKRAQELGYQNMEEVAHLIYERTGAKWAYFNGF